MTRAPSVLLCSAAPMKPGSSFTSSVKRIHASISSCCCSGLVSKTLINVTKLLSLVIRISSSLPNHERLLCSQGSGSPCPGVRLQREQGQAKGPNAQEQRIESRLVLEKTRESGRAIFLLHNL